MSRHIISLLTTVCTAGCIFFSPSAVNAQPSISVGSINTDKVGLYEKFEITLVLDAAYSNPYDPGEIDLRSVFTSPSGKKWEICGFYDGVSWKIRFSPDETGEWKYDVKVTDSEGMSKTGVHTFTGVASSHHGRLEISPNNHRYLIHEDGVSFYGIGMNYPNNVTEAGLDSLAAHGATFFNYANWGTGIHNLIESNESGIGRYDQIFCSEVDRVVEWSEARGLFMNFRIWNHVFLSETVWGTNDRQWDKNPYKTICAAGDFFTDPVSWEYQKKLYRYLIARWGYSPNLTIWGVVNEIDGTDGWEKNRADAESWAFKVYEFLKKNDPWHRPITGCMCGGNVTSEGISVAGPKTYWSAGYKVFDIANRKNYYDSRYQTMARDVRALWNEFEKPCMVGSIGDGPWGRYLFSGQTWPSSDAQWEAFGRSLHDALWVALANGVAITPQWWHFTSHVNGAMLDQMKHFSGFVSDIDFANLVFEPVTITAGSYEAYVMRSDMISFGWIINAYGSIENTSFTITGLSDGEYTIQWYDTWSGRVIKENNTRCINRKLISIIPASSERDIAFKIQR